MSTDPNPTVPPVNPRPGLVQALGIFNIVVSLLLLIGSLMTLWMAFAFRTMSDFPRATVTVGPGPAASGPTTVTVGQGPAAPAPKSAVAFNPFMGMNDPILLKFSCVDGGTGLLVNALMFVSGLGLLNRRRWGARWWAFLAWAKIFRLLLLWSVYIVVVAPIFSENMARNAALMIQQQGMAPGKIPPVGQLTQIYSITNLILAVSMMLFGSIYPAISLWVMGRPGFKAALVGKPAKELELP